MRRRGAPRNGEHLIILTSMAMNRALRARVARAVMGITVLAGLAPTRGESQEKAAGTAGTATAGTATAGTAGARTATAGKAKKPTAKKPTAKKPTVKKSTVKKPTAKKPAAKKQTAKAKQKTAKPKGGSLGPGSETRHLAFRDAGSDLDSLWPPKMPAQLPNAILPSKRIIAFYGNPLSQRMGILGEFAPPQMLAKLEDEVAEWNRLDPKHPVQPALHLIAVVAQAGPGRDGKYRLRMDSTLIEKVYGWARSRNAILFLDVQVGLSTLQEELPRLEKFLRRPDVHLGIDPEFSMKDGSRPGKRVGTYDAADINFASRFLQELVDEHQLPPKVLVVHRFTKNGVTNASRIRLDPRVQVVMHMDGFGAPWLKRDSFYSYIKKEPVQFAGWKQFTKPKNDTPRTTRESILRLWPVPLYIQLQ